MLPVTFILIYIIPSLHCKMPSTFSPAPALIFDFERPHQLVLYDGHATSGLAVFIK